MSLNNEDYKKLMFKILSSRLRILNKHPFFGLMLMHLELGIDDCETAYTTGNRIVFGSAFLNRLTNSEVDFIMMHEVMHIVLKHCNRGKDYNNLIFNIACDIVVNSNILFANNMDLSSITVKGYGVSMHLTPSGKEGYLYSAEEVYNELINTINNNPKFKANGMYINELGELVVNNIDIHDKWEKLSEDEIDKLNKIIKDTYNTIEIRNSGNGVGKVPLGLTRMIGELTKPKVDWKVLLSDFICSDYNDYSFNPPDRRIDSDFMLPDFNVPEEKINVKILFNVDTSGSISNADLTKAFSEIKSVIDFSNGGLEGYIVCSDSDLYDVISFQDYTDIDFTKIKGGGGTDFNLVFNHFEEIVQKLGGEPDYIVILTDGYGNFPKEEEARGIPVLWIINNNIVTPPWGVLARM